MSTAIIEHTQEWHEQRMLGVGSSDSASLFPMDSKFGCDTRLWFEKRGITPDYQRTEAEQKILSRGHRFEEHVAQIFTEEYGFKVRRMPSRIMRGFPHMRANVDRQIMNATTEELKLYWPELEFTGPCGPGALEIKTSNKWTAKQVREQGITPDEIFQVQHELAVTGYQWGIMAKLDLSTLELICFPIIRNESIITLILERAESFWALVENGPKPEPPNFPQGDTRCRSCIFRKTCRGEQYLMQLAGEKPDTGYVSDDSFSELVSDLRAIKEQGAVITATEKEIIARIQERMETANIAKLEVPSVGARIRWAEQKAPVKWDTKALEAEAATVGRKLHFAEWVETLTAEQIAEIESVSGTSLVAEFCRLNSQSPSLAVNYKHPGKPTRPFVLVTL